jgi:uncharacterized protein (DUF58 family)
MVSPARRLLIAVAGWIVAAVLAVALPVLWPLVGVAALGLVGLVLWDAALLHRTPALEGARELPAHAFAGREAAVQLTLHNPGAATVVCDLIDETPSDLAVEEPVVRGIRAAPAATACVSYAVRPRRRGDRRFGPAVLLVRSPLGLLRRRASFGDGAVLRVYPDAAHFLRPEALDPRRVLEVIGVKPAPRRGDGMDFESLRDYLPGDDPRRVDWRATARRGRLVVRQLQHERNHTVVIAVDASRLMAGEADGRTKLDHAVDAALALAYAALTAGDRVGLVIFDRDVLGTLAPRATRRQFGALLELLRPVEPRLVEADYEALLRALALHQRQRALLVVLTDFVEASAERFTAPLVALSRRHRVLLVALRDRVFAGIDAPSREPHDLYRRVVLDDLLHERETALGTLRRRGVQTLDLPPAAITAAVLNRYLAIRYGPDR